MGSGLLAYPLELLIRCPRRVNPLDHVGEWAHHGLDRTKPARTWFRRALRAGMVEMTQQYIIGELTLRLMLLQASAPSDESAGEFQRLRLETETASFEALPYMAMHALDLVRGLCRDSLARGDLKTLTDQATMAADLREFAVSASLLAEG